MEPFRTVGSSSPKELQMMAQALGILSAISFIVIKVLLSLSYVMDESELSGRSTRLEAIDGHG